MGFGSRASLLVFAVVAVVHGGASCIGDECAAETDSTLLLQSRTAIKSKDAVQAEREELQKEEAALDDEEDEDDEASTRALLNTRDGDDAQEQGICKSMNKHWTTLCKCAKSFHSCRRVSKGTCVYGDKSECKKKIKKSGAKSCKKAMLMPNDCKKKCKKILDKAPGCSFIQSESAVSEAGNESEADEDDLDLDLDGDKYQTNDGSLSGKRTCG